MCPQNINILTRRYNVPGARTFSNYCWGTLALVGGIGFLIAGLYSYYLNFFSLEQSKNLTLNLDLKLFLYLKNTFHSFFSFFNNNEFSIIKSFAKFSPDIVQNFQILFFPQGLAMCFYGVIGILLGGYVWFCIIFQIGCGFTEFNKTTGNVRIFRLGFPGEKRVINITYTLENIQSICVKIPSGVAPASQRGIYMRIKFSENQIRDIPLDLYSEKASLESIELQAADLSKFLQISLSTL